SHETRMAAEAFGDHIEDIKPIIQVGGSDSASLDGVFEVLIRAGRILPMVKSLMVPEAAGSAKTMPQAHRDMYSYLNSVMEPWDGPAALAMTDGRWVLGGMDRNGLRPMRYAVTRSGLVVAGSESGMVRVDEAEVIEKGRLGPGQMLGVDLVEGKIYRDREIKDLLAGMRPFSQWVKNITRIDSLIRQQGEVAEFDREELRRRQLAFGWSLEELEIILHPMVEDGKEPV